MLATRRPDASPAPVIAGDVPRSLAVDAPGSVDAGAGFTAVVSGAAAGDEVRLDLVAATGVERLVAIADDGSTTFEVGPASTRAAGMLHVIATTDAARGDALVEVRSGSAVDGIVPLAGPRSMIADGAHWTMVTAIPTDALGNGLPDGTLVTLHIRRPDGSVETIEGTLDDLLSGIRVWSGTLAGLTTIRVDVDGATGPEVQVAEVPGPPAAVSVEPPTVPVRADGRTLLEVTTGVLADRFGNVLLDGTSARLVGEGPDGRFSLVGVTIEGRATFRLQAPITAGAVRFTVFVDGVASPEVSFTADAEVADVPVAVARTGEGEIVRVDVGPVLTVLGGEAPDGTTVTVTLPDGTSRTVQLRRGTASIELSAAPGARLVVSVLGATTEVVAP
jgi:hypothetical protein